MSTSPFCELSSFERKKLANGNSVSMFSYSTCQHRQTDRHVLIEHLSSHTDIDRHIDRQADRQIRSGQALNQVGHGLQAHPVAGLLANPVPTAAPIARPGSGAMAAGPLR